MGNNLPKEAVQPELTRVRQTLYPTCDWDERLVRRLICAGSLAPIQEGKADDGGEHDVLEECPICMYYYPLMNRSSCCRKAICTECYLQIAPEHKAACTSCPFCKAQRLAVVFVGPRSEAELSAERERRDELIAVQIKMLQNWLSEQSTPTAADVASRHSSPRSSATASPRMPTPLPSPELLASSPRAAALLASAELASMLPLAYTSTPRAPPIQMSVGADREGYAERWERAQREQLELAQHSSRANQQLPPPPDVVAPPRTLEGIVGTAALSGSMAGWSHAEAEDVEELMVREAIRVSLEQSRGGSDDGGAATHPPSSSTAAGREASLSLAGPESAPAGGSNSTLVPSRSALAPMLGTLTSTAAAAAAAVSSSIRSGQLQSVVVR